MKKLLCIAVCLVFVLLVLLSGCTPATQNGKNTAGDLPFTVPGEIDYATNEKPIFNGPEISRMDMKPLEMFYYLLENYCNSIVIAKYKGMEDEYKTYYAFHNFELIEVIKGDFSEEEFQISAPQNKEYEDAIYTHDNYMEKPYKKGENCIVFIKKSDRILYGVEYNFCGIFVSLDINNEIEIIQVADNTIDIGLKTIDEFKTHLGQYIPLDEPGVVIGRPYTTSDKLEDAFEIAENVYRIRPTKKKYPFDDKIYYQCDILEILKGEKPLYPPIDVVWYDGAMETGREYIILSSSGINMLVSEAHGYIPIEDTARVNQVYELLGIQR